MTETTEKDITELIEKISNLGGSSKSFKITLSAKDIYIQSLIGSGFSEIEAKQIADTIWSKGKTGKITEEAKKRVRDQFNNFKNTLNAKLNQAAISFEKIGESVTQYGNEMGNITAEVMTFSTVAGTNPYTATMVGTLPTKITTAITQYSKATNSLMSQISMGLMDNTELVNLVQSMNAYSIIPKTFIESCKNLVELYNKVTNIFGSSNELQSLADQAEQDFANAAIPEQNK